MAFPSVEQQLEVLLRGCEAVYSPAELRAKLEGSREQDKPLRVKLGLDPTAPDIHLGHTVVFRKIREFQDFGHKAVVIVGDYTAMVGDPSEKSKTRPTLSRDQVEANAQTYLDQAGRVLDTRPERLELRRNSEWLADLSLADALRLASKMTVARMLERDTFEKRYKGGVEIYLHEFLYPLLQGRDSVAIEADIELGGSDQTFNNLVGRDLQRDAGQPPQVVMIMPILVGLDGVEKMSKSLGNYVAVTDSAHDMFGKLMSVPDELMRNYFELLTAVDSSETNTLCDLAKTHPMEAKKRLARTIAEEFHSADDADRAQSEWEAIHQKSAAGAGMVVPEGTPTVALEREQMQDGKVRLLDLVMLCGFASSRSEGRRLAAEGGIRLNGQAIQDVNEPVEVKTGDVLQRGKRRFAQLEVGQ